MTSDAPAHTTRTPPAHTKNGPVGAQIGIKIGQVESRIHFQLFWALSDHSVGVVKVAAAWTAS